MLFADRLHACGFDPSNIIAHRIALNPADADDGYRTNADLVRTGHALVYQRLQDGPVFGKEALVAAFVDDNSGRAQYLALRRLVARRPGLAPGDIVYDPDIAHLLHNFIARAQNPMFYDAFDAEGDEALRGTILRWPSDAGILRGDDPSLLIDASAP